MSRLVCATPGRLRLRDPALRQSARLAQLAAALGALEGVREVATNRAAGSLVLYFDAAAVAVEALETAAERLIDDLLHAPRATLSPSLKRRVNRYAKYGMLGSLAASLALAAAGQKRWHAVGGGLFVACLGAHLAVHRRHLLK